MIMMAMIQDASLNASLTPGVRLKQSLVVLWQVPTFVERQIFEHLNVREMRNGLLIVIPNARAGERAINARAAAGAGPRAVGIAVLVA